MNPICKTIIMTGAMLVFALPLDLHGQQQPTTLLLQSRMLDRDMPVNDRCDFLLALWRSPEGTSDQVGQPQLLRNVPLQEGRFSLLLNAEGEFGTEAFQGQANWLHIAVKCTADAGFVSFPKRQWVGEAAATLEVSFWTADGGGGVSTGSGGLELTGSIGQPDAGRMTATGYEHIGGWLAAAGYGYRIYLPLIGKTP